MQPRKAASRAPDWTAQVKQVSITSYRELPDLAGVLATPHLRTSGAEAGYPLVTETQLRAPSSTWINDDMRKLQSSTF